MRRFRERLDDILEAIAHIEGEKIKGKDAFDASPLIQTWMVHHLMIIGEAVRAIDPAIKEKHPSVPWRQISGMRNVLVHDYFRINREIVWQTIEDDLPRFKTQVKQLFECLPRRNRTLLTKNQFQECLLQPSRNRTRRIGPDPASVHCNDRNDFRAGSSHQNFIKLKKLSFSARPNFDIDRFSLSKLDND